MAAASSGCNRNFTLYRSILTNNNAQIALIRSIVITVRFNDTFSQLFDEVKWVINKFFHRYTCLIFSFQTFISKNKSYDNSFYYEQNDALSLHSTCSIAACQLLHVRNANSVLVLVSIQSVD